MDEVHEAQQQQQDPLETPPMPAILEPQGSNEPIRTRSRRIVRPPARYTEFIQHDQIAFETLHVDPDVPKIADDDPMIALKATSDPDTLYLWEARKQPDFNKFLEAIEKEIDGHTSHGN